MADRKAINKYYPPDWDPNKGSINKYRKSHPLRHRARKIDQGIITVRFEMPFNIWCSGCDNHIGMGVRYNAEKTKIGNYYTTPIYKFRMKCHLCDNYIEIQTEPSKLDYTILHGARKQIITVMDMDDKISHESNHETTGNHIHHQDESARIVDDAMYRLERKIEDQLESEKQLPTLRELKESTSRYKDTFAANALVRAQFREHRRKIDRDKDRERKISRRIKSRIPLDKSEELKKEMLLNSAILTSNPTDKHEDIGQTIKDTSGSIRIKKERLS